jgi:hypothetical protein
MDPNSDDDDGSALRLEELNHLYENLSPEERDELLQCLLIAAPRGGEAMANVLKDLLLCHAMEELLGEPLTAGETEA